MNKTILITILTFCTLATLQAQMNSQKQPIPVHAEANVVFLTETDGETVVNESGETSDSYFITLRQGPAADVNVSLTFNPKQIQIGSNQTGTFQLVFAQQNWQIPQQVQLKALDDSVMERLRFEPISHVITSVDPNYNGAFLPDLNVRILDNDGVHRLANGYTIPTIDLDHEFRQLVIDRRMGVYLGHPTTTLLADQKTLLTVYPTGHGQGAIQYKRSKDGGLSWSQPLPTPESWKTSKEVPTIFRMTDASGKERLILFSGLYPARRAFSEDNGSTWSELEPVGEWGGIVVMGGAIRLKDGRYLAMFHDDGRFFTGSMKRSNFRVFKTYSDDGGLTWSFPEVVIDCDWADPCEPGIFRSPDGNQILVLLRENSRRFNSLMITSDDEGETWSHLRELPAALTGDRHTGVYTPDGRLFISFRDLTHDSPTKGDWVGWVGTYDDIINGREGQYRIRLKDNLKDADCAYPGVEILPDSTIVTTTYGHWSAGEEPYIVSSRFKLTELTTKFAPIGKGDYKIITFGNSTTAPRVVDGKVLTVYTDHLRRELPLAGITGHVLNKGVSGNTTVDALTRLETDVLNENPSLVIIQLGLNDASVDVFKSPPVLTPRIATADYFANLRTMIQRLKARNIQVVLMTPNAMSWNGDRTQGTTFLYDHDVAGNPYDPDDPNGVNNVLVEYVHAVRNLASAEKIRLVDIFGAFHGYGNVAGQSTNDLLPDGMHPNARGHRRIADAIYRVLSVTIPASTGEPDHLLRKSSLDFQYKYEANAAEPTVENPGEWTSPFGKPKINGIKDGILNCTLGQDLMWISNGLAPAVLKDSLGWSFEARLKVISQTGSRGAITLSVDDLSGSHGHVNGFQIHVGRTQWCMDATDADSVPNDDDFHIFRLAEEPRSDYVHGWRDGVYLGQYRHVFNFPQAVLATFVLFGSWSREIAGTIEIDYVRWDPLGAYRPLSEPSQVAISGSLPVNFRLLQNYPNPFNATTVVPYAIAKPDLVDLAIFNSRGERVRTLVHTRQQPGAYHISWDARGQSSGIYFYRISTPEWTASRSCVLIK